MHLLQQDLITGLIAIAIIAITLLCIELAAKNKWLSKLLARKLLHISAICTCAWTIYRFENRIFLAGIFFVLYYPSLDNKKRLDAGKQLQHV